MDRRLWEVDVMRGVALALMLLFNWTFALRILDIYAIVPPENWTYWWLFPRFIGFLFVFIVGVSLTLSVNRLRHQHAESWWSIGVRKYPRRGGWILGLGLAITVVTYVVFPDRFIYFGVLHLIGVSIILAVPFLMRPFEALITGIIVIGGSMWVGMIPVNSRVLGAIGFDAGVPSLDYFPVFPWTGVVLIGVWTGHILFPDGHRRFSVPAVDASRWRTAIVTPIAFLGRHTLIIYLAHQPALGLVLLLLGFEVI